MKVTRQGRVCGNLGTQLYLVSIVTEFDCSVVCRSDVKAALKVVEVPEK